MHITQIENDLPNIKPVTEKMNIFIPGISEHLPNRNGAIVALIGAPGTGKSSLLLSLFRDKQFYKKKFNHIFLLTPESSFISVIDHPFAKHDKTKIVHDLTEDILENIFNELVMIKKECILEGFPLEYSCLIIDDFASDLKRNDLIMALKKFLTKSRHICCMVIMTLQAYNLLPLVLRKLLNNIILFKPNNRVEMESVRKELINLNESDTMQLFNYVYDERYNHLHIDTSTDRKCKNFNELIIDI